MSWLKVAITVFNHLHINSMITEYNLHVHVFTLLQMNLASQSVLEGLNAVLDHRGEVS